MIRPQRRSGLLMPDLRLVAGGLVLTGMVFGAAGGVALARWWAR
jgi:hypothetical protein